MEKLFFNGWQEIFRTLIIGTTGYIGVIIILRSSGKRTLTKLNAFDSITTIALGSLFASAILNKDVSLTEFIVSFFLLVYLQYTFTWISFRVPTFQKWIKAEPTLIYYDGNFLEKSMKKERITKEEIVQKARQQGYPNLEGISAIILETAGEMSFVTKAPNYKMENLYNVSNLDDY